jgi:4-carboxymuconolactone decarboxylase
MARIPLATRDQIVEKEKPVYDAFMVSRANAHAAAARQAGVRDDIVDSIREKHTLAHLDPDERTAVDFTRELLQDRKVSRPTFDAATARFGQRGTMTLTNLIACYAVLAYNMNTYALEAPAHPTEPALTE